MYYGYYQIRPQIPRQYSANVCSYRLEMLEKKIHELDRTVYKLSRKVHRLEQLAGSNRGY
ncbi:hypothetical protein [Rossellomorea aquimaris]|jgi:hypothetical protein|uniref:Uncharacterized protein n=1 Tax=Rossellomorea aquimaris TaxID=189382 RepID=A0A1J6WF45_9BACI|nr:hypothetical protein [Rossellomorea aquimaris]OIU70496.1 hypothetical protein BHE18_12370 [Rossellomorea aquimaris]